MSSNSEHEIPVSGADLETRTLLLKLVETTAEFQRSTRSQLDSLTVAQSSLQEQLDVERAILLSSTGPPAANRRRFAPPGRRLSFSRIHMSPDTAGPSNTAGIGQFDGQAEASIWQARPTQGDLPPPPPGGPPPGYVPQVINLPREEGIPEEPNYFEPIVRP